MNKEINRKLKLNREIHLKGHALSKGVAVARVCLFNETQQREQLSFKIDVKNIEKEKKRVKEAFETAIEKTRKIKEETEKNLGKSEADIFRAHITIMKDMSVRKKIKRAIENQHKNAESAVSGVLDEYEMRLSSVDNEYMKERASDISGIKKRILSALGKTEPSFKCEMQADCVKGKNRIIVAEELTPHMTMDMNSMKVGGFVTEHGGTTSHAAILAKALGIPAVSGIKGVHSLLDCGVEVLINGNSGEIIINPKEETVAEIKRIEGDGVKTPESVGPLKEIEVMANINLYGDIKEAVSMQAEGIGLYRTEFEFIIAGKMLSEDEQYRRYVKVVKAMNGKPVYFRVLDLGSDKPAPGADFLPEENPALGLRGARYLESNVDLLKQQVRAIARASKEGDARIMVPMVTGVEQYMKLVKIMKEATSDINPLNVKYGVMFEVPSACLEAEELLEKAEFASIGSNDLIQYLFAVDRNNDMVVHDYDPDRKVFWRLLADISRAAKKYGCPLSICGEMASEPRFLKKIMKTGIKTVSVSPRFIPDVRLCVLEKNRCEKNY